MNYCCCRWLTARGNLRKYIVAGGHEKETLSHHNIIKKNISHEPRLSESFIVLRAHSTEWIPLLRVVRCLLMSTTMSGDVRLDRAIGLTAMNWFEQVFCGEFQLTLGRLLMIHQTNLTTLYGCRRFHSYRYLFETVLSSSQIECSNSEVSQQKNYHKKLKFWRFYVSRGSEISSQRSIYYDRTANHVVGHDLRQWIHCHLN